MKAYWLRFEGRLSPRFLRQNLDSLRTHGGLTLDSLEFLVIT